MRKEQAVKPSGRSLSFSFYQHVQPWHPQGILLHNAAMAVGTLGGDDDFFVFSDELFKHVEEERLFADRFRGNGGGGAREDIESSLLTIVEKTDGLSSRGSAHEIPHQVCQAERHPRLADHDSQRPRLRLLQQLGAGGVEGMPRPLPVASMLSQLAALVERARARQHTAPPNPHAISCGLVQACCVLGM